MSAQGKADSENTTMNPPLDPALLQRSGLAAYRLGRLVSLSRLGSWHSYALIATPRTGMPAMPAGYSSRAAHTMADLEAALLAAGISRGVAESRLSAGGICLMALRGDTPVGVTWVYKVPVQEDEIAALYDCGARAAWDLGLHVAPEHRASRAFSALWAATGDWLDAQGLQWSLSRIALYNEASLRAHARLGARLIGQVQALRLGNLQWLRARVAETACTRITAISRPPKLALVSAVDALEAAP